MKTSKTRKVPATTEKGGKIPAFRYTPRILKAFVDIRTRNPAVVTKLQNAKQRASVKAGWQLCASLLTKRVNDEDLWEGQVPRLLNPAQVGLNSRFIYDSPNTTAL